MFLLKHINNMVIYILKLTNNKYYICKRDNLDNSDNKLEGNNTISDWVSKYPIIEVYKVINTDNSCDIDKYVKEYMQKYGIDNVRGGSYNQIQLSQSQQLVLDQELNIFNNLYSSYGQNNIINDYNSQIHNNGFLFDYIKYNNVSDKSIEIVKEYSEESYSNNINLSEYYDSDDEYDSEDSDESDNTCSTEGLSSSDDILQMEDDDDNMFYIKEFNLNIECNDSEEFYESDSERNIKNNGNEVVTNGNEVVTNGNEVVTNGNEVVTNENLINNIFNIVYDFTKSLFNT